MKIRPHRDRIVVKVLDADTVSKGGILIPDAATEKPNQGRVLAVGQGRLTEAGVTVAIDIKENDTVLFGKSVGQTVKVDGEEYLILKEEDIMAVIEE
jgi:chaperonin GroES